MDKAGKGMENIEVKDKVYGGVSFIYWRRDGCLFGQLEE